MFTYAKSYTFKFLLWLLTSLSPLFLVLGKIDEMLSKLKTRLHLRLGPHWIPFQNMMSSKSPEFKSTTVCSVWNQMRFSCPTLNIISNCNNHYAVRRSVSYDGVGLQSINDESRNFLFHILDSWNLLSPWIWRQCVPPDCWFAVGFPVSKRSRQSRARDSHVWEEKQSHEKWELQKQGKWKTLQHKLSQLVFSSEEKHAVRGIWFLE